MKLRFIFIICVTVSPLAYLHSEEGVCLSPDVQKKLQGDAKDVQSHLEKIEAQIQVNEALLLRMADKDPEFEKNFRATNEILKNEVAAIKEKNQSLILKLMAPAVSYVLEKAIQKYNKKQETDWSNLKHSKEEALHNHTDLEK
jgi:hypothetical protein